MPGVGGMQIKEADMAIKYAKTLNRRVTPQSQPIPGSTQVPNSAGGYSWEVDDWTRFDRFLILGAEGGTYYIAEQDLVKQNHDALVRSIKADGVRAVNRVVEISDSGRAPKNDPAIFALALVAAHGHAEAKALAFQQLGKVCRIGTHLFHFAEYVNALRGWGRGLATAKGRRYGSREGDGLALQAVKYQQRHGWSHGDLLRLAHPKAPSREHEAVFRWMLAGTDQLGEREVKRKVRGEERVAKYAAAGELPKLIAAFEQAKKASSRAEIVNLITEHDLPREVIPTQWLNEVAVWDALLQRMPMTAMIRNLGKMTSVGLVEPFSDAAKLIVRKLGDETSLKRARIHPLALLIAEKVYAQGKGDKGALAWKPVPKIIDALGARTQPERVGLCHVHGQRNLGGQYPPGAGIASVSQRVRRRCEGGRCRHDLQRLHSRRPKRPRNARRGRLRHVSAGRDRGLPSRIANGSRTPRPGNNAGGAKASTCTFNFYPVSRAVQAAVCKTPEAGAIPARDSIFTGISVERYTPVFQTGIEGALPSCPSTARSLKVRRLLRE